VKTYLNVMKQCGRWNNCQRAQRSLG